jgi:hypothetical protein
MRRFLTLTPVLVLALINLGAAPDNTHHARADFVAVNGSGVGGFVNLVARPQGGTTITVHATGLTPGTHYLSIYYDNHVCNLESDSVPNDVFVHYVGGADGTATAHATIDDNLDEVNSVSVRLDNSDLTLQACADTHPGG